MLNWKQFLFVWACFAGFTVCALAEDSLRISMDDARLQVLQQDQVLMEYAYRDVPFKPYVQALAAPSGLNILRDAPADHLHHHGLMFAISVNDVSFWAETEADGQQIHQAFHDVETGDWVGSHGAGFTQSLVWKTPAEEAVLLEERTVRVMPSPAHQATLLSWTSACRVPAGIENAEISGAHYYGLGMRFIEAMDQIGRFLNARGTQGEIFRGEERLAPAEWSAYQVTVEGQPLTVAMFDHPHNFRPVTWFTMPEPFAYLSATLNYHEEPFTLSQGEELDVTYGVAVLEGHREEQIEGVYDFWLNQMSKSEIE